jgi:hypothetical protein
VTDAAGTYYPPHGHAIEFPTGRGEAVGGDLSFDGKRWAYIDGTCEIALPAGELTVEATKGPHYRPLNQQVHLPAGKLALRFSIECPTDWRQSGMMSGDARAHFLAPHAALLEAAAEDLEVVNLLARELVIHAADGQSYRTTPNLIAFSGQRPCLEADGRIVVVNTLNCHPVLGRLGLLNAHRVVYPLAFGGSDHTDDWTLSAWCGQCHRKNGLVVWADAFDPKAGLAGAALASLVIGEVDAIELNLDEPAHVRAWYHVLNAGIRAPIVGGSAKDSNRVPLGSRRTFARLGAGESRTYAAWIEAVRRGRTIVSAGPMPSFQVHGESEGTVHERESDSTQLLIHFAVDSLTPVEKSELVANCAVVAAGSGPEERVHIDLPAGGWLAVRCWQGGRIVAHTSPQYVVVKGKATPIRREAIQFLDGHLLRAREWIRTEGRFENPSNRERMIGTIDAARQALLARAAHCGTIDGP